MGNFISFDDEEDAVQGKKRELNFSDLLATDKKTLAAFLRQQEEERALRQAGAEDETFSVILRLPSKGTEQLLVRSSDGSYSLIKRITFGRGVRKDAAIREVTTTMRVGRLAAEDTSAARYLGIAKGLNFNGKFLDLRLEKAEMNLMTFMNSKCESKEHVGELFLFLLLQVARALHFIHNDLESVLGNLTPESIMVRDTNTVPTIFITSLKHLVKAVPREQLDKNFAYAARGAAAEAPEQGAPDRDKRDPGFLAPEVAERAESYATKEGDVWSFGALMLWLVSGQIIGRTPGPGWPAYQKEVAQLAQTQDENLRNFVSKAMDLCEKTTCDLRSKQGGVTCIVKMLNTLPPDAARLYLMLMRHCLQPVASNRPTMAKILAHPLFTNVGVGKFESASQLLNVLESEKPLTDSQEIRMRMMQDAEDMKRLQVPVPLQRDEDLHPHDVSGAFDSSDASPFFARYLLAARQQIGTSMHSQLVKTAPELETAVTAAMVEGLAHADSAAMDTKTKLSMKDYGANLLAGFDFALNVGSELPFETRRKVLKQAAASLERNGIPLSVDEALQTQDGMLYARSPVMFADNEVLSERRQGFNSQFLTSALNSPLPTLDFIKAN